MTEPENIITFCPECGQKTLNCNFTVGKLSTVCQCGYSYIHESVKRSNPQKTIIEYLNEKEIRLISKNRLNEAIKKYNLSPNLDGLNKRFINGILVYSPYDIIIINSITGEVC